MIRKLYAVQGKNQQLFVQRASILRELVTVTNLLKKPKNDVGYVVFLKTEEKLDCYTIIVTFSHENTLFLVMRAILS